MTRPGPSPDLDEVTDLSEPARHEMVFEAAAIFGAEAARELANRLRVPFEPYTTES